MHEKPNSPKKNRERIAPTTPLPRLRWPRTLAILKPFAQVGLFLGAGLLFIFFLGLAQRIGWIRSGGGGEASNPAASSESKMEYTCPMHLHVRSDDPDELCPECSMALVPLLDGSERGTSIGIKIDPAMRRIAGIATEPVIRKNLRRTIRAIGAIQYDEGNLKSIAAYIDGRIERLYADYTGVQVNQGDEIALLYSPELYAAQAELLQALQMQEEANRDGLDSLAETQAAFAEAAQERLIEMGMIEEQISELIASKKAQTRIAIRAPLTGTVIEKNRVEGEYVSQGTEIYRIADLSRIWVLLKLFPEDAALIRYGQRVEAEVKSHPGKIFEGRVSFVDPVVDASTRTVGVRVVIANEEGLLKTGDYASARIYAPVIAAEEVYDAALAGQWISPRHPHIIASESGPCPLCGIPLVSTSEYGYADAPIDQTLPLVIPRSAPLMLGDTSVVFVEVERGEFETRSIILGPLTDEYAVVVEGLALDEMVATAGNFLIDSQMQLNGLPSLLDPSRGLPKVNAPMPLDLSNTLVLQGEAGRHLEQMIQDYSAIQISLAMDKTITKEEGMALADSATLLWESNHLALHQRKWIETIRNESEHLHERGMHGARRSFRTISHALLSLASEVRGEIAPPRLIHYFCSMYDEEEEGGGDWMQLSEPLANPYFGSTMLRCGTRVHDLIPPNEVEEN